MKAYLEYCGGKECRETISSLMAQRAALLAAAKAALPYIEQGIPSFEAVATANALRQAIQQAENKGEKS